MRVIQAARAAGLDVAGIEIKPDGAIRILDGRAAAPAAEDEYERHVRLGLL